MKDRAKTADRTAAAVFLLAFALLSWNLWNTAIASGWIDPVLRYGAQDEGVYTHEAIRMITRGGWMTPTVLGRWVFEKPPLLVWLSALSMRVFGIGPFAARLPAVLAGALVAALCYAIARRARSTLAGAVAALLCVSDQLLFTMSRHNMTDILLAAATVAAVAALARDPELSRPGPRAAFAAAIAAAVMAKSAAGVLPLAVGVLFALLLPGARPARLRRTVFLGAAGIVLASPWFVYNFAVHREWFSADMGFQLFTVGVRPLQNSSGNHVVFYATRLFYAAPAAAVLALAALPGLVGACRKRQPAALLLSCYLAVFAAALLVFRFRSEQYLTPLLPAVILLAAVFTPIPARPALAAIVAVFLLRVAAPEKSWGMSYSAGTTVAPAAVLSSYCEERRGNTLYILGVNDEFYGLALPLPRLYYGWIDPERRSVYSHPYLEYLGILRDARTPPDPAVYGPRLRAWGLDSAEPLGTGILARDAGEFANFVLAHPESDFLISSEIYWRLGNRDTHIRRAAGKAYVLLESGSREEAGPPPWTCRM